MMAKYCALFQLLQEREKVYKELFHLNSLTLRNSVTEIRDCGFLSLERYLVHPSFLPSFP